MRLLPFKFQCSVPSRLSSISLSGVGPKSAGWYSGPNASSNAFLAACTLTSICVANSPGK